MKSCGFQWAEVFVGACGTCEVVTEIRVLVSNIVLEQSSLQAVSQARVVLRISIFTVVGFLAMSARYSASSGACRSAVEL
ncbi:MAG: hypothetical protein ACI8Z5_002572 [Lentimonas sp.]|jgi:hypothetical protein